MNLLEQAHNHLFEPAPYTFLLEYSGKFRGYNANIRQRGTTILARLSKQWQTVSPDIQLGLLQDLLCRLLKKKRHSIHIDLYNNFLRSVPHYAPKTQTHPVLEQSFLRLNDQFFNGMMAQPNLRLGNGVNLLGTYHYSTDTVTISRILLDNPLLLDYVMYHELLHKKHQFKSTGTRTCHHTKAFRDEELLFPYALQLEKELELLVRKHKRGAFF